MYIDAKSARFWTYLPTDTHIHSPPGSTLLFNRIELLWLQACRL